MNTWRCVCYLWTPIFFAWKWECWLADHFVDCKARVAVVFLLHIQLICYSGSLHSLSFQTQVFSFHPFLPSSNVLLWKHFLVAPGWGRKSGLTTKMYIKDAEFLECSLECRITETLVIRTFFLVFVQDYFKWYFSTIFLFQCGFNVFWKLTWETNHFLFLRQWVEFQIRSL